MKPFVRVVGVSLLAGCAKPAGPTDVPAGSSSAGGSTASGPATTIPEVPPGEPGPVVLHPGPPGSPPLQPPTNPPMPTANPPAPLPTWDEVVSNHPPGATNPPFPVLVVARDTGACFKEWFGGMIPPPPRQRAAGGLVLEKQAETAELNVTQIVCPEGQPAALLEKWDHPDPPR